MKKFKVAFNEFKSNYELRSFLTSSFSFFINIAFLIYNLIFGIIYRSIWNWSISMYYALLVTFRAIIIFSEKKWNKLGDINLEEKRLKLFRTICWCMIIMDISLIAPIILMVQSKRTVNFGMIPTIAMAAYTTYKITIASINFSKKKSKINLSIRALRLITLKDAIVSILTLQNTMLMVFSNGNSMLTLAATTSTGMLISMITITVFAILSAYKKQEFPPFEIEN